MQAAVGQKLPITTDGFRVPFWVELRRLELPPSDAKRALARWMLENGTPEAKAFLGQLETAEVAPWRRDCCASIPTLNATKVRTPEG